MSWVVAKFSEKESYRMAYLHFKPLWCVVAVRTVIRDGFTCTVKAIQTKLLSEIRFCSLKTFGVTQRWSRNGRAVQIVQFIWNFKIWDNTAACRQFVPSLGQQVTYLWIKLLIIITLSITSSNINQNFMFEL